MDEYDIEEGLKQHRTGPGTQVKDSVMDHFKRVHGGSHRFSGHQSPWRRPVPLYFFAGAMAAAIGLSFLAGRMTFTRHGSGDSYPETRPAVYETDLHDIQWEIAPNDLI